MELSELQQSVRLRTTPYEMGSHPAEERLRRVFNEMAPERTFPTSPVQAMGTVLVAIAQMGIDLGVPLDIAARDALGEMSTVRPRGLFVERLILWGFHTFFLSMLPLLVVANGLGAGGWQKAIYHGELMLVAIVLAGNAVTTSARARARSVFRTLVLVGSITFYGSVAIYYGLAVARVDSPRAPTPGQVSTLSMTLLVLAFIIGLVSLWLEHTDGPAVIERPAVKTLARESTRLEP